MEDSDRLDLTVLLSAGLRIRSYELARGGRRQYHRPPSMRTPLTVWNWPD